MAEAGLTSDIDKLQQAEEARARLARVFEQVAEDVGYQRVQQPRPRGRQHERNTTSSSTYRAPPRSEWDQQEDRRERRSLSPPSPKRNYHNPRYAGGGKGYRRDNDSSDSRYSKKKGPDMSKIVTEQRKLLNGNFKPCASADANGLKFPFNSLHQLMQTVEREL